MSKNTKQAKTSAAAKKTEVAITSEEEEDEILSTDDTAALIKSMAKQFMQFTKKMDSMDRQAELRAKTKIIDDLQSSYSALESKINTMEQYNRSYSVRILNIPVNNEEEKNPFLLRDKVYRLAFHPILVGAMADGEIPHVPTAGELIEMAHVLPGKAGAPKPVIARFRDRIFRTICLRHKKAHSPRLDMPGSESGGVAGAPGSGGGSSGGADGDRSARGGGGGSRSSELEVAVAILDLVAWESLPIPSMRTSRSSTSK
jgi:hypothetical protein